MSTEVKYLCPRPVLKSEIKWLQGLLSELGRPILESTSLLQITLAQPRSQLSIPFCATQNQPKHFRIGLGQNGMVTQKVLAQNNQN